MIKNENLIAVQLLKHLDCQLHCTADKKQYGFQDMYRRLDRVEQSMQAVQSICSCVDDLGKIREMAMIGSHCSDASTEKGCASKRLLALFVYVTPENDSMNKNHSMNTYDRVLIPLFKIIVPALTNL